MALNKLLLTLAVGLFLAPAAQAKVTIRVPLIFAVSSGNARYNVSDLQEKLQEKGLEIPEFIYVGKSGDSSQISKFAQQIEDADIKVKGQSIYLMQYVRLSDYMGKGVTYPLCYSYDKRTSIEKAAREAYDIAAGMTDGVLSDQYSVWGVRFFDKNEFSSDSADEDGIAEMKKKYGRVRLKSGEVQIIATTNDSGDDDADDILSPCP